MSSYLSPSDALRKGLCYVGVEHKRQAKMSEWRKEELFHVHFGSFPLVIASIWFDLCSTRIRKARLEKKEMTESGFIHFMADGPLFFMDISKEHPLGGDTVWLRGL
jgi:hypothetical protein